MVFGLAGLLQKDGSGGMAERQRLHQVLPEGLPLMQHL